MVPTGIRGLDGLLSGGVRPGLLVDVFGANGTGKTQLLHQLASRAGAAGEDVLYVDTTGRFRPERIVELQGSGDALARITVSKPTNTSEQVRSTGGAGEGGYSLVLVDNITDLYSYEYRNDGLALAKNAAFMSYMGGLARLAVECMVPVVVTNMVRVIDGREAENMRSAASPFAHVRVHLSKEQGGYSGTASWAMAGTRFRYRIGREGLSDVQYI